jgi:hypothetical protein
LRVGQEAYWLDQIARDRCEYYSVAAGPALALELPFPGPSDRGPGAGQAEGDAGLGDYLDEAGPRPA